MANKKSDAENAKNGCLALVGISILVLLFTVLSMMIQLIPIITPALFIILLFTNWYKYRFVYKPLRINGFWLSKNEKNKFMSVADYICTAQRNKDYVHAAVQNEGIRINQDGRISAKSYRGKDLRNVLDNAYSTINEHIPTYRYLISIFRKTVGKQLRDIL